MSKKQVVVAVVGATGAVGEVLLRVLEERQFPVSQLLPLASTRSAGTTITFAGQEKTVEVACPEAFDGVDLVFFAATGGLSRELAPEAVKRGAVVIDKSSTWRMDDEVPLVVPEINADALEKHRGIIANPNCTTTGLVMAVEPIRRVAGLKSLVVTTLQAVSGSGTPGIDELDAQVKAVQAGKPVPAPEVFAHQIAYNPVPVCGTFRDDAYTDEERKLLDETRKIMALPDVAVSMTCVRVPVPVGHSATVLVETERPISPEAAREAIDAFPGTRVVDDPATSQAPTAADVEGTDEVLVGRIRRDLSSDRLWLWQVSDNLRKGAATNAVQIAEALLERGKL